MIICQCGQRYYLLPRRKVICECGTQIISDDNGCAVFTQPKFESPATHVTTKYHDEIVAECERERVRQCDALRAKLAGIRLILTNAGVQDMDQPGDEDPYEVETPQMVHALVSERDAALAKLAVLKNQIELCFISAKKKTKPALEYALRSTQAEVARLRDQILWCFSEEEIPTYIQGKAGEHEINSIATADECNGMTSRIVTLEVLLRKARKELRTPTAVLGTDEGYAQLTNGGGCYVVQQDYWDLIQSIDAAIDGRGEKS